MGLPVVGKVYPAGGGEEAFGNMQEVWRSSFGERRRPPGLPRPVEYLPDLRMLVMERLEGRPLVELGAGLGVADDAIRLLASLHDCDARPTRRRSAERIVRSIRRKGERVARLAPRYADHFCAVTEALEEHRPSDGELAPSHGDFGPRNLLLIGDRLVLLDWDRLQLADPARDLASWGTAHWVRALRERRTPGWSALDRAAAVYGSARGGTPPAHRLRFHVAASLMRVAHISVELRSEEATLVPRLATEALRQLR
jgi:aminoglycoside phosphotransferase (APT) family kinase protein